MLLLLVIYAGSDVLEVYKGCAQGLSIMLRNCQATYQRARRSLRESTLSKPSVRSSGDKLFITAERY